MNIECQYTKLVDIDLITPNPKNPNKHNSRQIEMLAKIMKHQGWRSPIVVSNRSGFIVAGHARLEAAAMNGWPDVPVDYQDFKTEADEYAHMVADNKIAELAETDLGMVNLELIELGPDFDIEMLGLPSFEIEPADKIPEFNPDEDLDTKKVVIMECPHCGQAFEKANAKVIE